GESAGHALCRIRLARRCQLGIEADELRKLLEDAGLDAEAGVVQEGMAVPGPWTDANEQGGGEPSAVAPEVQPNLRRGPTSSAGADDAPPTNSAIYFRDISATTLLTAEEEIELAQLIENGEDCKRQLKNGEDISEDERERHEAIVMHGERA